MPLPAPASPSTAHPVFWRGAAALLAAALSCAASAQAQPPLPTGLPVFRPSQTESAQIVPDLTAAQLAAIDRWMLMYAGSTCDAGADSTNAMLVTPANNRDAVKFVDSQSQLFAMFTGAKLKVGREGNVVVMWFDQLFSITVVSPNAYTNMSCLLRSAPRIRPGTKIYR